MAKSNFEKLTEIKHLISLYDKCLEDVNSYPHLCFSQKKLRDCEYYDGVTNNSRKTIGTINIIDLPEDLGLKELVLNGIKEKRNALQAEFDSYIIQK